MVGWHHPLDGHESEPAPGVGDGQGSLACCSTRGPSLTPLSDWTQSCLNNFKLLKKKVVIKFNTLCYKDKMWYIQCTLDWSGSFISWWVKNFFIPLKFYSLSTLIKVEYTKLNFKLFNFYPILFLYTTPFFRDILLYP